MPNHTHHYRPVPVACAECGNMATIDVGALTEENARLRAALEAARLYVDAMKAESEKRNNIVVARLAEKTLAQIDVALGKSE